MKVFEKIIGYYLIKRKILLVVLPDTDSSRGETIQTIRGIKL